MDGEGLYIGEGHRVEFGEEFRGIVGGLLRGVGGAGVGV